MRQGDDTSIFPVRTNLLQPHSIVQHPNTGPAVSVPVSLPLPLPVPVTATTQIPVTVSVTISISGSGINNNLATLRVINPTDNCNSTQQQSSLQTVSVTPQIPATHTQLVQHQQPLALTTAVPQIQPLNPLPPQPQPQSPHMCMSTQQPQQQQKQQSVLTLNTNRLNNNDTTTIVPSGRSNLMYNSATPIATGTSVALPPAGAVAASISTTTIAQSTTVNTFSNMPSVANNNTTITPVQNLIRTQQNLLTTNRTTRPSESEQISTIINHQLTNPRLKVEDALSYLDKVKIQFSSEPHIYNDFLDIMKEFKTNNIDTPGVIGRVSTLFRNCPELLEGFNSFLPLGCRIESHQTEQGASIVAVRIPSPPSTVTFNDAQKSVLQIIPDPSPDNMLSSSKAPQVPVHQNVIQSVNNNAARTSPQPTNITSTYQPINHTLSQTQAAHQAVNQALCFEAGTQPHPVQDQSEEFAHAINYVNKIKNRFLNQPEKYKKFLEILHTYQVQQRHSKEVLQHQSANARPLTESEVYNQVAKLFASQEDLLAEFGQFLPDAIGHHPQNSVKSLINVEPIVPKKPAVKPQYNTNNLHRDKDLSNYDRENIRSTTKYGQMKRSPSYNAYTRDLSFVKKPKVVSTISRGDVAMSETASKNSLTEYAFFDKVRRALKSQEVYDNFLRCLTLFNQDILSKSELVQLTSSFLGKFPELCQYFKDFLGVTDSANDYIPNSVLRQERCGDNSFDVDYASCKRLGASYCQLPPQKGQRCSGWTELCQEVLNDTWVSFPTWSEDSSFVTLKKTQFEEYMYRVEDERFELDVVIDSNAATIHILQNLMRKINAMSSEELKRFRIDDNLGATSNFIHVASISRIYGDKGREIIEGIKRNPTIAIPIVLKRLQSKEDEWRAAKKEFEKRWRELNEKNYLKSLDYQGITFKQNDLKTIRSKNLLQEIQTIYEERSENNYQNQSAADSEPHMLLYYKKKLILDDACNLLIHHVKRQTSIQKSEKQKIKQILKHFISDLFFHPRLPLSDDECDDDEKGSNDDSKNSTRNQSPIDDKIKKEISTEKDTVAEEMKPELSDVDDNKNGLVRDCDNLQKDEVTFYFTNSQSDEYRLFMGSSSWYNFFRLHALLCERLSKIYDRSVILAKEEERDKELRRNCTAELLKLKPAIDTLDRNHYLSFLDMVKNVLDGNIDCNYYEDSLRELFGIHAYFTFSLDRLIPNATRQLQHCVSEKNAVTCYEIYQKECKNHATGGLCLTAHKRLSNEMAYQKTVEQLLKNGQPCFKFTFYKENCRLAIEYIDTESEEEADSVTSNVNETKEWNNYVENYVNPSNREDTNIIVNIKETGFGWPGHRAVFLTRNFYSSRKRLRYRLEDKDGDIVMSNTEIRDDMQCRFNTNSYKMHFINHKELFVYRKESLHGARKKHPKVTLRMNDKFHEWHKAWVDDNVPDQQKKLCVDWFMGRIEGLIPGRTRAFTYQDFKKPPYSPYTRYRVDIVPS